MFPWGNDAVARKEDGFDWTCTNLESRLLPNLAAIPFPSAQEFHAASPVHVYVRDTCVVQVTRDMTRKYDNPLCGSSMKCDFADGTTIHSTPAAKSCSKLSSESVVTVNYPLSPPVKLDASSWHLTVDSVEFSGADDGTISVVSVFCYFTLNKAFDAETRE